MITGLVVDLIGVAMNESGLPKLHFCRVDNRRLLATLADCGAIFSSARGPVGIVNI